ncbi:MAG: phosphodiester glycosidase family protein [Acidobacteria bacterium]|nr:phosphodiester glycosidase family protein [Acidobacteriota bacterium]
MKLTLFCYHRMDEFSIGGSRVNPGLRRGPNLVLLRIGLSLFTVYSLSAQRQVTETSVTPGFKYIRIQDADEQLGIHVIRVDLRDSEIGILSVIAQDGLPGRETVPDMSKRYTEQGIRVLGGINADFWSVAAPLGLTVIDGQIARSPNGRSSIGFSREKNPFIDVFVLQSGLSGRNGDMFSITSINRFRNDSNIVLYTDLNGDTTRVKQEGRALRMNPAGTAGDGKRVEAVIEEVCAAAADNPIPDGRWIVSFGRDYLPRIDFFHPGKVVNLYFSLGPANMGLHHAVSGGPRILRNGEISVEWEREGIRKGFDTELHPRTAAGYTADKRFLVMAVIDGRRPGYSRGVDLYELAELMRGFGCADALNLDGGGSSTMVVLDRVVNRPSDRTGIRPVSSGLFVIRTER